MFKPVGYGNGYGYGDGDGDGYGYGYGNGYGSGDGNGYGDGYGYGYGYGTVSASPRKVRASVKDRSVCEGSNMSVKAMKQSLEALTFDGFTPQDVTHREVAAKAVETLRTAIKQASESEPVANMPSQTHGMNLGEHIKHVGGVVADDGRVIFGSPMAVDALILQVLRDNHPAPGVPDGWRIEEKDGELIVKKNGFGGYSARKNAESIAEAVLHELALDLLAASPAQKGGER